MELKQIGRRVYLLQGPVNIGVVLLKESKVLLIDSGLDENYARQVEDLLQDYRFEVQYIFNSHAHADHTGGNRYFQKQTGCKIYAPALEAPMIRQPLIQSAVMFGGAPIKDLANRFIMSGPSQVEEFNQPLFKCDDLEIKLVELPGHSINQKGFLVEDVAFVADAIFPEKFFKRQRIPFVYNPFSQLDTFERLRNLEAACFVGGHFAPCKTIRPKVEKNFGQIMESLSFMRDSLKIPQPEDRIVKAFMDHFDLKKNNWEYFLYRTMVHGYLSSMFNRGEIKYKVMDNLLVWYAI
jgi:glyoxylase-like metal-dependent hydrolase (beta-lactamase superfamily II)